MKKKVESEHSEFGGSQAERIINCPGSVRLSRGIPRKSNLAAERGTLAHKCLEVLINNRHCLQILAERKKLLNKLKKKYDEDMIEHGLDALTHVQSITKPNGEIFAEVKVDSSKFTTKDQKSTLDIGVVNWDQKHLIILDYKFGTHTVEAKNNFQLMYYALAFLLKIKGFGKIKKVTVGIIQPNSHHKKGHIRTWNVSVEKLISFGRLMRRTTKIALKKDAPLKHGDWCFFCPANSKCPIIKQRRSAKDFPDLEGEE